ncbi:type II secretion system protein [Nocardioides marmoriginsengisoli]|uniref:Type II secretion system protein n=1 Tax=Nocardioides marmoriginsengisoli TaxID=661483 RepID=A0A3N0CFH0_9ACTN|nr:type II secretion system F family protein [Nocardioides marmoriginsengisoli]RNL62188.1 type II secretion system protein [Nocardioides marmoriginsengisoli]
MTGFVVAALITAGALLVAPVRSRPVRAGDATPVEAEERALLVRLRVPLTGLAVFGAWSLLGGLPGVVAAAVAGVAAWRVLSRVESPAAARRRRAFEQDLPMAVHLLGAALAAGASTRRALLDVAEALPGPIAEGFRLVHDRLALGLDPVEVWRSLGGPLEPIGRSLARAHESGASVVAAVDRVADGLRSGARFRRDALARSVEVRAAAPLGLCFLPAFLLVGVVPMVVGIFSSVRLFS